MARTPAQQRGMQTSASDRWFTPTDLLAEIERFLGEGYLDPCPAKLPGEQIESGLWVKWRGRVFVNPPYGRVIGKWIAKAMSEPVDEIVLLLPARTDTEWFQPLYEHTILFVRRRLRFSGVNCNAPFPSVLVYRGYRPEAFAAAFAHRGPALVRSYSGTTGDELSVQRQRAGAMRRPSLWVVGEQAVTNRAAQVKTA